MNTLPVPRLVAKSILLLQVVALVVLLGTVFALMCATLPSALGNESFVVSAANMAPAMQPGDLAVVSPTRASALALNDVITYRMPQNPDVVLTRRVLFIDHDASGRLSLQVRGDGEPVAEQVSVDSTAVLGRLMFSLPRLGMLVDFARGLPGKAVLFGLPALLYVTTRLPQPKTVDQEARVEALLRTGRRALEAGHAELALRAAEGVLALDQYNRGAWILKAAARKALEHVAA